jgi:predicted ATPase
MAATADHPDRASADAPRMAGRWQVVLLGRVEARNGELLITRFNSQPTAALLARLVLFPQRAHAREELAELLWPGAPQEAGRNRLRQALSTLKRLLEPPGSPPVFSADRNSVRLNAEAVGCDVSDFEAAFRQHQHDAARALYRGELMPGFYDDWVQDERRRLATLHDRLDAPGVEPAPRPAAPPAAALPPPAAPSLPAYLTRYFGREDEQATLLAATAASRLVTLAGVGGCGKTRLAVEVARRAAGFDWVAFVPLADCQTAAQALAQLRTSLQLPPRGPDSAEPLDAIAQAFAQRRVLLVLDNFEQLAAAGGSDLVERLLARVAGLHLIVTSRRVLGLAGEREVQLEPLPLPQAGAALEQVAGNPGAALFIDRARGVRPDFQVTARNHEALGALCRALEGVPLAIELAAARCRVFSLQELHDALARPLALLERTGARAGRVPRQDSLRGAIEWSWRLLDDRQQRFLAALSIFRGGWSVADAEAVCDEPQARELLEALAGDSLLRADVGAAGAMRFRMLVLIREFLGDKLEPERARALRGQHRAHVLALALGLQARNASALDADELPNVQQALRSALDDGHGELALTLGVALRSHWDSQGIDPELLGLLCRAADSARGGAALPPACTMLAGLLLAAGDVPAARAMAERALVLAEDRALPRAAALCAWVRVVASGERRYAGLVPRLEEAQQLAAGQPELIAQATALQGVIALGLDHDPAAAEGHFGRAAQHWLAAGRVREARLLRYDRALCLLDARRFDEALAQAELCERECEAIGERARRVAAINLQGVVLAQMRRWADALQTYRRCLREAWGHHLQYWLAFALWNHGRNLARLHDPERAARLMAFSEQHWTRHFGALDASDQRFCRVVRRLVRAQIGLARTDAAWAAGQGLTLQQAVLLALEVESAALVSGL